MKRLLCLLLSVLLLLSLAGCKKQEETPPAPGTDGSSEPAPVVPDESIRLSTLKVEFVVGERDPGVMMQLKRDLPPLLIDALAAQDVEVGAVELTFGTSPEATAEAAASGAVQLAVLPLETYLMHERDLRVAAQLHDPAAEVIGLFAAEERAEKVSHTREGYLNAAWALPVNDERAMRYLNNYFASTMKAGEALTVEELPNVSFYTRTYFYDETEGAELLVFSDVKLLPNGKYMHDPFDSNHEPLVYTALDTVAVTGTVAAVSAADEIVRSDQFVTALQEAVIALAGTEEGSAALALYIGVSESGEQNAVTVASAEDFARQRAVLIGED